MLIEANWKAPAGVKAFTTTVAGGVSEAAYSGLNLGEHVGDCTAHVKENRLRLQKTVGKNVQLCWLHQTHSDKIVDLSQYQGVIEADASVSQEPNKACVVMTADCLPVLLCSQSGNQVAALHCGWKGLYQNLITKTIQQYFSDEPVIAWLGPAIGQQSYEVDEGFYERFLAANSDYHQAFLPNRPGHYLFDLYQVAQQQLAAVGVMAVYGGGFDTFTDNRFYSYRRSEKTGRMASIIYRY